MVEYIKNNGLDWFKNTLAPAQDIAHTGISGVLGATGRAGPAGPDGVSQAKLISKRIYLIRLEQHVSGSFGLANDIAYIKLNTGLVNTPPSGTISYYLEGFLQDATIALYSSSNINVTPYETFIDNISSTGALGAFIVKQITLPTNPFVSDCTITIEGVTNDMFITHISSGVRFYAEWTP